jgi:hypothetical protein
VDLDAWISRLNGEFRGFGKLPHHGFNLRECHGPGHHVQGAIGMPDRGRTVGDEIPIEHFLVADQGTRMIYLNKGRASARRIDVMKPLLVKNRFFPVKKQLAEPRPPIFVNGVMFDDGQADTAFGDHCMGVEGISRGKSLTGRRGRGYRG